MDNKDRSQRNRGCDSTDHAIISAVGWTINRLVPSQIPQWTVTRVARLLLYGIICFIIVGSGPIVGTTAAQQGTAITVGVDGDRTTQGGELIVQDDVRANITVNSDETISLVEVRIDGEIQHSFRPENQSFSRSVPLQLGSGENTVEVITDAGSVSTYTTMVTKWTAAPRVKYSSPFSTSIIDKPANETNVSEGQVTLAGTLHTVSDVDRIMIEQTHMYNNSDGDRQTSRELHRITDPGTSFSQELLLGTGENEIVVRYIDAKGRVNKDTFRLIVDDATDPKITLDAPTVSYTNSATIGITVRDETKLDYVAFNRTSTNGSQILLERTGPEPDADRINMTDEVEVSLYNNQQTSNEFQLVTEDTAGNTKNKTVNIEYDPNPQVSITENTTNATNRTVRVAGNVSKVDVTRVTLETIDTQSGERIDIARVYETNTATDPVEFNQTLKADSGPTLVNLIVTYDGGKQYTKTIKPPVEESDDGSPSQETTENQEREPGMNNTTTDATEPNPEDIGDDDSSAGIAIPIPLGIGFREMFGGVIIVGSVYLLGHWV